MSNPILKMCNNAQSGANGMNGGSDLLSQFKQFKSQFSGDPKTVLNNMLNSGRFNQAQIQQARSLASQLKGMFK